MQYDLIIRNGMVIDGTGAPAFRADVAVQGDRIAAIGRAHGNGTVDVDAAGLVVSPGFIDAHNHADHGILSIPGAHNFVAQGITTSVAGNCGLSLTPIVPDHVEETARYLTPFIGAAPEYDWQWGDLASFFQRVEKLPMGQNLAVMTGHGTLRIAAMGFESRPPTTAEQQHMEQLLRREIDCGAAGLSFGLYYPPGNFARPEELAPLMRIAGERGLRCSFHLRSESTCFLQAVDEIIALAAESGAPVNLSHHKAVGRPNWGKITESLRTLDRARKNGVDIVIDGYPYTAGSTTIVSLLPPWVAEGGLAALLARLGDPMQRALIRDEVVGDKMQVDNLVLLQGWDRIIIGDCPADRSCEGKTLTEILHHTTVTPESLDALMDWLITIQANALMVCPGLQSEDDLLQVLESPLSVIASDAWIVHWQQGSPHPRAYGSIPRFLGRYVRDGKMMRLEDGVRKATSATAARFGLTGRGVLAETMFADIAVWDADAILDTGDFFHPHQYPAGLHWVFVNGQTAMADGRLTNAGAGRILPGKGVR